MKYFTKSWADSLLTFSWLWLPVNIFVNCCRWATRACKAGHTARAVKGVRLAACVLGSHIKIRTPVPWGQLAPLVGALTRSWVWIPRKAIMFILVFSGLCRHFSRGYEATRKKQNVFASLKCLIQWRRQRWLPAVCAFTFSLCVCVCVRLTVKCFHHAPCRRTNSHPQSLSLSQTATDLDAVTDG